MLKNWILGLLLLSTGYTYAQSSSAYLADKPEGFKNYWNEYGCTFSPDMKEGLETTSLESLGLMSEGTLLTSANFDPAIFQASDYDFTLNETTNLLIAVEGKGILVIPSMQRSEKLWTRFTSKNGK